MSFIPREIVDKAKQMDLVTYMKMYEPDNLVALGNDRYCCRDHDSLKMDHGLWYWYSRGFGGRTALDYLIRVRDMSFKDAVELIIGGVANAPAFSTAWEKPVEKRKLLLMPQTTSVPLKAVAYLQGRGIDSEIINRCIQDRLIYEDAKYHNVIFVGRDKTGKPRYAAIRGTLPGSTFKGEIGGSDKRFAFSLVPNKKATELHIFEAAIDLLSYLSLQKMDRADWQTAAYLSMAGIFKKKNQTAEDKIPVALEQFLQDYPDISKVHIHFDNDDIGRGAAQGVINCLTGEKEVVDEPPMMGCKDVNDELLKRIQDQSFFRQVSRENPMR